MIFMRKITFNIFTVLIFLCIAGSLVFRVFLLNMSYEYDEMFTAVTSDPELAFSWIYSNWLMPDVHPPLHNAILWVWNHFVPFGPEIWLRLPSLFFGIGALAWAWFGFPRRFGKDARLMFLALLSSNLYVVLYSQHARSYTLTLLWAVPLTFLFLNMSRRVWLGWEIPAKQWVKFGVLSLLSCWSHYFGALLFGLFSVFLFAQAFFYKRKKTFFILVPCAVFLLFLPWLLPNFLQQFTYHRFGGYWWANEYTLLESVWKLGQFFFTDIYGVLIAGMFAAAGLVWRYGRYKKTGVFAYSREILLLLGVCISAVTIVTLISLRTYMLIGRYFMAFLPCMFLWVVLLSVPLLRKRLFFMGLLVFFLGLNLYMWWTFQKKMIHYPQVPARLVSRILHDHFSKKELFVVALEAFPPPVIPALYGFYINRVYGQNTRVTDLLALNEEELAEALARQRNAVVIMPNCTDERLKYVITYWKRSLGIYERISTVCFLEIFDPVPSFPDIKLPPMKGRYLPPRQKK